MIMMTLMTAMAKVKLENCELATSSAMRISRPSSRSGRLPAQEFRFKWAEYFIDFL